MHEQEVGIRGDAATAAWSAPGAGGDVEHVCSVRSIGQRITLGRVVPERSIGMGRSQRAIDRFATVDAAISVR